MQNARNALYQVLADAPNEVVGDCRKVVSQAVSGFHEIELSLIFGADEQGFSRWLDLEK